MLKKEPVIKKEKSWLDIFKTSDDKKEDVPIPEEEEEDPIDEELFLQKSEELQIKVQKVMEKEKLQISNNELVFYNIDWFNVCTGIQLLDNHFEGLIKERLSKLKYEVKISRVNKTFKELMNDSDDLFNLKRTVKKRLLKCSDKSESYYDQLMSNFRKDENDLKSDTGIFYLYEEYRHFLHNVRSPINRLHLIELLIYCEERQMLLSAYVSHELMRRRNNISSSVDKILERIFVLDADIIKKNEEEKKKREEEKEKEKEEEERKEREREEKERAEKEKERIEKEQIVVKKEEERKQVEDRVEAELEDRFRYEGNNKEFLSMIEKDLNDLDARHYHFLNDREQKVIEERNKKQIEGGIMNLYPNNRDTMEGGGYSGEHIRTVICPEIEKDNELKAHHMQEKVLRTCF